jgi:hypothetical protein
LKTINRIGVNISRNRIIAIGREDTLRVFLFDFPYRKKPVIVSWLLHRPEYDTKPQIKPSKKYKFYA